MNRAIRASLGVIGLGLSSVVLAAGNIQAPSKVAPVQQAQNVASTKETSANDAIEDEPKICRTYKVTGSRAKRTRICMTKKEWAFHEAQTRDQAGRVTNQDGICASSSCSGI